MKERRTSEEWGHTHCQVFPMLVPDKDNLGMVLDGVGEEEVRRCEERHTLHIHF